MGQVPRDLRPDLSPVHLFGARLRELREAAGLSQARLGRLVAYSGHLIGKVEKGERRPQPDLARRCDDVLHADGKLIDLALWIREGSCGARKQPSGATTRPSGEAGPSVCHGGSAVQGVESLHVDLVRLPAGRYFDGTDIEARVYPAIFDGRVLVQPPTGQHSDSFLARSRRGLVVGSVREPEGGLYGLDVRHARRRLASQASGSRLLIPSAYLLDEVTLGLLWAAANFDEALLADDRILFEHEAQPQQGGPKRPTAWLSTNLNLSMTSAMWLGSEFCAEHILRNVGQLTEIPAFWTREQRGEEASAWLLFAHKYTYLKQLSERFPGGMTRTFCIPESTVGESTVSERILVLLVAGLMESFDIQCLVTNQPEYSTVDGFVLDANRRAIVANWIGVEAMWFADVTDNRATVREYADANGYARAHSIVAGPTPLVRLQSLATYLGLSWPLIIRRCGELAEHGLDGIAQPRSRLLSLNGVERACRYLGSLSEVSRLLT